MQRFLATAAIVSITLCNLPGMAQAASMVEFAKRMDELHKYGEFKRSDPTNAAILAAPSRSGSMVEFAKKISAAKKYESFSRWCHYKKNGDYTCDHPKL